MHPLRTPVVLLPLLLAAVCAQEDTSDIHLYNSGSKVVFTSESEDKVLVEVQGALEEREHFQPHACRLAE